GPRIHFHRIVDDAVPTEAIVPALIVAATLEQRNHFTRQHAISHRHGDRRRKNQRCGLIGAVLQLVVNSLSELDVVIAGYRKANGNGYSEYSEKDLRHPASKNSQNYFCGAGPWFVSLCQSPGLSAL